ncbi:MAG: Fur family transcriptional regulator [Polyangiales bacterium]
MFRTDLNKLPDAAEVLRAAGLRITAPRRAILEELAHDKTHPTAVELYERLLPNHPGMAFATVYNTLNALSRAGYVSPLTLGGATRFDPITEPHDHLVCRRCGSIEDLAPVASGEPAPASVGGFAIDRVERVFRGVCASCQREPDVDPSGTR